MDREPRFVKKELDMGAESWRDYEGTGGMGFADG